MFWLKVKSEYKLLPADCHMRLTYAQAILNLEDEMANFLTKIIMRDAGHFYLSGYVNKDNEYRDNENK